MKHIAIIYDKEQLYAEKLSGYFNASDLFPFETRVLSTTEQLNKLCDKEPVDVLIVDEKVYEEDIVSNGRKIIVLTSNNLINDNKIHTIYKYQEAEQIIKQIVVYLSETNEIGLLVTRKKQMKLISFYSPVKRTFSTTMAIGMGQVLGKHHKTLYINLESFSGLEKLAGLNFSKDIMDLLYHIESKSGNIGMVLSGIIEQIDCVDIIPPVKSQSDIIVVELNQWKELINKIEQDTDYEYIILDLSEAVQGLIDILDISDYVVTCVDNDELAISKIVQYENSLKELGYESILKKTKKCNVPNQHRKNGEIHYLPTGELGEYISNVLQGMLNEM